MKTKYIDVDGYWGVVVCYDIKPLDEYEMRQNMMAFGIIGERLEEAVDILYQENTGMCISRDDIRMSLIFIGRQSGEEQFWDTMAHELYHSQCAITDYYNVRCCGEDSAWLMGYLMRQAVMLIDSPYVK